MKDKVYGLNQVDVDSIAGNMRALKKHIAELDMKIVAMEETRAVAFHKILYGPMNTFIEEQFELQLDMTKEDRKAEFKKFVKSPGPAMLDEFFKYLKDMQDS